MKPHRLILTILGILVWGATSGTSMLAAEETNERSQTGYERFRTVAERNIFNGKRSGRSSRGSRETRRPTQVETIALVGTMSYEKGHFAFFEGSGTQYRLALKPDETIAGFKLMDIATRGVKLDGKGQKLDLRVGSQLRREDGQEWKVTAQGELPTGSTANSSISKADGDKESSSTDSESAGTSGDSMNETLKRLLEQREKETK